MDWFLLSQRFSVAASIIGLAFFAGHSINKADVIIYNGLSIPVTVHIAGENLRVDPLTHEKIAITEDENYVIESRTTDGSLIEKFTNESSSASGTYIYNIASAAAMQEWTVYYTSTSYSPPFDEPKQHIYGGARWFKSRADYFFTDPPQSIEMSGSYEEKSVLTAYSADPSAALLFATDKSDSMRMIRSHTLWDDSKSEYVISWLTAAATIENGDTLLASRLQRNQNDVLTLRSMQDGSSEEQAKKACRLCEENFRKDPENADLYYLTRRCMDDGPEQDQAFIDGYRKWPETTHGYLLLEDMHLRVRKTGMPRRQH